MASNVYNKCKFVDELVPMCISETHHLSVLHNVKTVIKGITHG